MIKIAVCIKQVPAYSEGEMDPKTGVLLRGGLTSVLNIYDLPAIETALRIKEEKGGEVDVFTMGPPKASDVIREAYAMGVDRGYLLSDRHFSGADVLATSYTLMQGITSVSHYDLILCGKQTTDGDTGQVSGALAKWLNIPYINWVTKIVKLEKDSIIIEQMMENEEVTIKTKYPCLVSVEQSIFIPRIPSLKLKIAAKKKEIKVLSLSEMQDQNKNHYGLRGSATKVEKIFPPTKVKKRPIVHKTGIEAASDIFKIIQQIK